MSNIRTDPGEQSLEMSLSVCPCLSVCVCLSAIMSSKLHVRSSNFLRMLPMAVARSSFGDVGILCTSGFMDDVILAHKARLLDVAAQLKRSAHAALGLAINYAQ